MSLHNLGTVVAFETKRTLQKPTFWAATLAIPILMVALMSLMTFSGHQAANSESQAAAKVIAFTYTDTSGLVDPAIAKAAGGTPTSDAAAARSAVVGGSADLFVAYPKDPVTTPTEVVARDIGLNDSGRYLAIASRVLTDSAKAKVGNPQLASLLESTPPTTLETYADGVRTPGWEGAIVPGLFLVLFYMAILMLGNQMLNITVEEKENRVTEMILTTIKPSTLILGKIVALFAVGIVQAAVLLVPFVVFLSLIHI